LKFAFYKQVFECITLGSLFYHVQQINVKVALFPECLKLSTFGFFFMRLGVFIEIVAIPRAHYDSAHACLNDCYNYTQFNFGGAAYLLNRTTNGSFQSF
jgi:hypothetical protein